MENKTQWIALIVLIIIVIVAAFISAHFSPSSALNPVPAQQTSNDSSSNGTFQGSASYTCDNGKSLQAAFYEGAPAAVATSTDLPPTPTGSAIVAFDNGQTYKLDQTISADGGRYSNVDGSLVFWDKGNTAQVLENNQQVNYTNCKTVTE